MRSFLRTSPGMTQNANVIGRTWPDFDTKRLVAGFACHQNATPGIYITRDILANIETLRSIATDKQIVIFAEVFGVPVAICFHPTEIQRTYCRIKWLNCGQIRSPTISRKCAIWSRVGFGSEREFDVLPRGDTLKSLTRQRQDGRLVLICIGPELFFRTAHHQ